MKDLIQRVFECARCEDIGIKRVPEQKIVPNFGDGRPSNPVWIVGLNPKLEDTGVVEDPEAAYNIAKYKDEKASYFERKEQSEVHSYFRSFQHIFGESWLEFLREYVFNTDLVKCASKKFDKKAKEAIERCQPFLKEQLERFHPKIVICNGSTVSQVVRHWFEGEPYIMAIKR